ncbi:TetR/AcrR family transcriptional regulator [Nocardia sp. NPDC052278]|uniref:TetR/AcrR family transcriptional regulator n=1 Tax=unclassified Nocardia TaxID=2637762 RepID=UPI00369C034E
MVRQANLRLVPTQEPGSESAHDAVVTAAWSRFLANGYAQTTLADIARDARISPDRLHAEFRNKRQILVAVRAAWLREAGFEQWLDQALSESDAVRRLDLLAHWTRRHHEAGGELSIMIDEAARTDPAVAQMWNALQLALDDRATTLISGIADQLAPWVTVRSAVDVMSALARAATYRQLVHRQHWSSQRYERWLAMGLRQQLLDDRTARPADRNPMNSVPDVG